MPFYEVNNEAVRQHQVLIVGNESNPIIVIDDFVKDHQVLKDYASEVAFELPKQSAYPGIRATLPAEYTNTVRDAVEPLIRRTYDIPAEYSSYVYHQLFSLVCTDERDLSPLQRIPHIDTSRVHYYALLHYLNDGDFGGTGFFRQRFSQYEKISERRYHHYLTTTKHLMSVNGVPSAQYCCGSTPHFELIAEIKYKPNRLVVYPGNILHTSLIKADRDVSPDPRRGRLTANVFLDFDDPLNHMSSK